MTALKPEYIKWLPVRVNALAGQHLLSILWTAVGVVLARDVYYLIIGLTGPLLADHSYRQTQTAITAFWIRRDGLKLAYETPVFGYPWSIPLEFPFYQWMVAGLNIIGIPIDVGGRLLSFAFLVACIWPMAILRKALALSKHALPISLVIFFSAPIYVYWGRAVLIETCALFFALLWLALVVSTLRKANISWILTAAIALVGSIAILQKATTFPVFGLIGGCFILARLVAALRGGTPKDAVQAAIFGCATCVVPLVAALAWIRFSDEIKLLNPLAESLTSQAMAGWNYGTWAQRHSIELWGAIYRSFTDVFGISAIIASLVIAYSVCVYRRYRLMIASLLIGFLAFFAIFTNLHIVHNYYQVANAVFLVCAAALALTGLVDARQTLIGLVLLLVIVLGQERFFADRYLWSFRADFAKDDRYQIALRVRAMTSAEQAILVLGQDYSSVINYYAERKGIALTTSLPRGLMTRVLRDPSEFLGGLSLGGIVACRPFEFPYEGNESLIDAYLSRRPVLATAGKCQLFSISQDEAKHA